MSSDACGAAARRSPRHIRRCGCVTTTFDKSLAALEALFTIHEDQDGNGSCPSVWSDEEYLGPAALRKTYRCAVDSSAQGDRQRLPLFDNERGISSCHTTTDCVEACPKEPHPTHGIALLKRAALGSGSDARGRVPVVRTALSCCGGRGDRRHAAPA